MYRTLTTMGSRLLDLFVPQVEASAVQVKQCWPQCWQCNRQYGGPCGCNARCCKNSAGGFDCNGCVGC